MKDRMIKLIASRLLEEKLGFKPSSNDIVLLEANWEDGKELHYVEFKRFGFNRIAYRATWMPATRDWVLNIVDTASKDELFI